MGWGGERERERRSKTNTKKWQERQKEKVTFSFYSFISQSLFALDFSSGRSKLEQRDRRRREAELIRFSDEMDTHAWATHGWTFLHALLDTKQRTEAIRVSGGGAAASASRWPY